MKRKIIKINEDKCNGCGLCAAACHEGAIGMADGKAKLLRDDYCDGLGDCLPVCPTNAITFEEREAAAYDEEAVKRAAPARKLAQLQASPTTLHIIPTAEKSKPLPCGCPGTNSKQIKREAAPAADEAKIIQSELTQWPVQIKLVPVNAPYFNGAHLLIAADCTAYAYADFHSKFIRNHVTLIGCPKLDTGDYTEKLTEIIKNNDIKSMKIVRMEVPCCGGIEHAAKEALKASGKFIPWQVTVISTDGKIVRE